MPPLLSRLAQKASFMKGEEQIPSYKAIYCDVTVPG